jgi:transcriptional regulator with XRE-family HTH domain
MMRRLRAERGWTPERLAYEARISRTLVLSLEGGKREFTLRSLKRVSGAFGIEPWELLRGDPR